MSSKYDVVKLKVHLSSAHYYILSRFLLSKMLMFCRIPEDAAVRISLDVKKHFVNGEQTSITQEELAAYLQEAMMAHGFSAAHTNLFPVVTQFHTERIPLVVLLAGPACRGKTTLGHLLSERVNCSTIINTEVLHDITSSIDDLLVRLPPKRDVDSHDGVKVDEPCSADAEVVAAVNAEVEKAVREGKVVIVEGERLRLSRFVRFLDLAFQQSAGAVILGVALDSLEQSARELNDAYGVAARRLTAVYTTSCVSVMNAGSTNEVDGTCEGSANTPTVFVARCHGIGDTLELATFLHNVVIQRVVGELWRRGKMPAGAEALDSSAAAQCDVGV